MNSRTAASHGSFYESDKLVEVVHADTVGTFPGYRAAHANGRIYRGTFTPSSLAKAYSRAAHFQNVPVPTTVRFSSPSGDPGINPANVIGMATKFYLPSGTVTDLIAITLPAFFAGTLDEFFACSTAKRPDPATGKVDPIKLATFLEKHPHLARFFQDMARQPASMSLAQTVYRALHAFRFVNAAGEGRWARYEWTPEAGVATQSLSALATKSHDYFFDELEARLQRGVVAFRLELQLAQEGDDIGRPSSYWPTRERVTVGRIELTQPVTNEEIGDPFMLHDPTLVTDGIEISPDDEIIAARRGAYLLSVAQRGGSWKRSKTLSGGCPFDTAEPTADPLH